MEPLPRHRAALNGVRLGLLSCPVCGRACRAQPLSALRCPQCRARLHTRKPDSLNRCSAWLAAAFISYLPANLLPIMQTRTLFGNQSDTILSGAVYLWNSGSWPLAMVVFVASILVPLLKILGLAFLLLSVRWRWQWAPLQRTRLYRLLELVGPWSMLDIFVVGLLVSLVNLRNLATIYAEPGALAFAAVVVFTMLAARAFDPRLIWDSQDECLG